MSSSSASPSSSTVLLATGGYDFSVRLFDAASGEALRSFAHADKQVNALAVSPDRAYLLAGGNPQLRLYDVNGKPSEPLVTYEGHGASVTAVGFQRDARWLYSASEDGTVRVWDPRAAGAQREYDARAAVHSVALHPNQGELVSGDHAGAVRFWDLASGRCAAELCPEADCPVSSVSVSADASLVTAANYNGTVYCWKPCAADPHAAAAEAAANGEAGSAGSAGSAAPAAPGFMPVKRLRAHRAYIPPARLSPDARLLATASSDHSLRLWRTSDWALLQQLQGHQRWVWDCSFSADSCYLASASTDATARLWEAATGTCVRIYSGGHSRGLTSCALADTLDEVPDEGDEEEAPR
jgi:target of rapamycin complex subunit LST8